MMRSVASNGHNSGWRLAETEGSEVSVIGLYREEHNLAVWGKRRNRT